MGVNITKGHATSTKCWHCKHAIPRKGNPCNWAMKFEAVEGWDAKKTQLRLSETKLMNKIDSYRVIDCPLFERG